MESEREAAWPAPEPTLRLGDLIAVARECRGMTLRQLSEASGVSNPLISQIETGAVKNPGFLTIVRLCTALHLPVEHAAKIACRDLGEEPRP